MPWVLGNHDVARVVGRLGLDQTLIRNPSDALRRGEGDFDIPLGARRARAAALLLLALPGSAYLYQGDELGAPRALGYPSRSARRPDVPPHGRKGYRA
jgi:alpha-glucosidase